MNTDKPNTRFLACEVGCGNRVWTDKRVMCAECRARRKALASLRLFHARGARDVPEYDEEHEKRIERLAKRAEQKLPLFAA